MMILLNDDDEIKKFPKYNKFDNLFKTNAKMGIGIDENMDYLITNILEKSENCINNNENVPLKINRENFVLERNKISEEKLKIKSGCC